MALDLYPQYSTVFVINLKHKRFMKPPTDLEITNVSPSKYYPKMLNCPVDTAKNYSPAFCLPVSDVQSTGSLMKHMVRTRFGIKPTPAPGDYNPKPSISSGGVPLEERGARCVFKSKTERSQLDKIQLKTAIPPPGNIQF